MKESVAIIGGGPAGFMIACLLDPGYFDVHLYEQKKSMGRKFLVAGKGGFNLTHASSIELMITKYRPSDFMRPILKAFDNISLQHFLGDIGIPTFIGSSRRVFPKKGIKPIQVLNAFKDKLEKNQVTIHLSSKWVGFEGNNVIIKTNQGKRSTLRADHIVYALGGKSWSKTGSDGRWTKYFNSKGIEITPFEPSNCGVKINWPDTFLDKWEGHPIKNIVVRCGKYHIAGEALITTYGLEGGAIYALGHILRKHLSVAKNVEISIDLKPTISQRKFKKFERSLKGKRPVTKILKEDLNLERVKIALIKAFTDRDTFIKRKAISFYVKDLKLTVDGLADLDDAISTVGGISLLEVDRNLQLKKMKDHYVIGEMLDWDAPTGGYLLQACFSMGVWVANHLNNKAKKKNLS